MTLAHMLDQREEIGEAKGEERLEKLIRYLVEDNRLDDMKKALDDRDYRAALYEQYDLK